jgi:hypothetical protein
LIAEELADPKIWLGFDVVDQKLKFSKGEMTFFKSTQEETNGARISSKSLSSRTS